MSDKQKKVSLVWFRQDLRLEDNPALSHACRDSDVVIPIYILSDDEGAWAPGGASKWWLHQSLKSLQEDFEKQGSRLLIFKGKSLDVLEQVIEEAKVSAVYWNRRYEPFVRERDTEIKKALKDNGVEVQSFNGSLLFEPWTVENKQGKPYKVYTPYWNAVTAMKDPEKAFAKPRQYKAPAAWPKSVTLDSLELEPKINWAEGMRDTWQPGRAGALNQLENFAKQAVYDYNDQRDLPAETGTSRLSPYLHFGEISPREIWAKLNEGSKTTPYLRQIIWREFAFHLLYHFPEITRDPLNEKFADFPWEKNKKALTAWQKGMTGYPIVDAGMRELWHTGWMHNRVRMIVGSFLVKDLRVHWHEGAAWFWDTLVDADLANNTMGWQWIAGCGADAAPYFRIFNPMTQGEKFDGQGRYVRKWIPEIASLPDKYIHRPWEAPDDVLAQAGIRLGRDYPEPIVDHDIARRKALVAYDKIKVKK